MSSTRMGRFLLGMVAAACLAYPHGLVIAKDEPVPLYTRTIARYPSPRLADVEGREYKVLLDATKANADVAVAFKDFWSRIRTAAAKRGFTVTEKEKNPLAVELSTKEYFDTPDQALWAKGYLVRITNRWADGKPVANVSVTVKSIHDDAERVLATPLAVTGGDKAKTEAEENVGFGPDGQLRGYVEKGSSFNVPLAALGSMTLGDFGKYLPELLKLGLPPSTPLVSTKAYAYRIRPGAVVLEGTEPCGVSMEAWARTAGGLPFLYDFSFGYGGLDFYAVDKVHASGERFMREVIQAELGALAAPDSGKWGGSKVRLMMNRAVSAAAPAAVPAAAAKPAADAGKPAKAAAADFITSPTAPVDALDAKYGVASLPAYIKHYEADKSGKVLLNPYLQVGSKDFPALLDTKQAPYNWVIDQVGRMAIIPEAAHPYGRLYPKGFFRPEDQSQRKAGTRENYGHPSALGGAPGRISGEILFDKDSNTWVVNNKSGRYSKHNADRSPEQLIAAATLMRDVVDPGKTPWGQVAFLLDYAPSDMAAQLIKHPQIQYDDPAKKSRPHLIVMQGGATTFKPEAAMPKALAPAPAKAEAAAAAPPPATPAAKPAPGKKVKAAHNDDPS